MPGVSPFREDDGGPTAFRSHFSNFLSALGPIFKFVPILGHNCFICPLWDYQNGVSCLLWGAKDEILCPL